MQYVVIHFSYDIDGSVWFQKMAQNLMFVFHTAFLVLFFEDFAFNDSLAVSAAAAIHFIKCDTRYIGAPS